MKRSIALILMMTVMIFGTLAAHAGDFKNVVVFGDSLSDNGNVFAINEGHPPEPYYEGRYSNGLVWVEYLVKELGIQGLFLNYAHGGAQTGETNVSGDFPGFLTQTDAYVNLLKESQNFPSAFALPKDTLFIIAIGANDFLGEITDPAATIGQAIVNIQTGITDLIGAGATNFLVMNLPDLGKTPRFNKELTVSTQVSQLAVAFNQALEQLLSGIEATYSTLELNRLDVFTFIGETVENYDSLGFTNAMDAQLDSEQGTIGEGTYIFWDGVHPTTTMHKLVAKWAAKTIICDSCQKSTLPYFENGLILTLPSVELQGNVYGFKMVPYLNPYDVGYYWMLDLTTLTPK